ncbi:helix-turn-helix domain-containing protein [Pseudooctadecabacter jejudonensis]|uniref:HTH-type transcriptional activator Btr n=1 Tax=Pseudooctadecabacter jejudonensis TaxID=1391910 RepID=A0A1Y5TGE2_9RHOB|nr:AraC family transcriptional regulator [Pseudooctadecabacter jejudonensis]SLN63629.1 HTH-type transcriptional activator Btr [Pseudooctadecabacter jejudonensis]
MKIALDRKAQKIGTASTKSNKDLVLSSSHSQSWTEGNLAVGTLTRKAGTEFDGVTKHDTFMLVSSPYSVLGGYGGQKDRKVTFLKNDFTFSLQDTRSHSIANETGQSLFVTFDKQFRLDMEASLPSAAKLDEPLTATSGLPNASAYTQIINSFLQSGGHGGRLRLESLITLILSDVYSRMQKTGESAGPTHVLPDRVLSHINEFIDAKCDTKISVQELADIANISAFHFSKVFKHTTGLPPHQYVIQHRLERVRDLLETSTLPLAQVAYEAGFSSQSHMNASFQQHFGASPGKYRKSIKS